MVMSCGKPRFRIPMRGNESWAADDAASRSSGFRIPMRGNEILNSKIEPDTSA